MRQERRRSLARSLEAVIRIRPLSKNEQRGSRRVALDLMFAILPHPDHFADRAGYKAVRAGLVLYTRAVEGPGLSAGRGWFITVEGPDGAGKTTQADALADHFRQLGHVVLLTREPGGTSFGDRVRALLLARTGPNSANSLTGATDPLADAFLFNAARRQLVAEVLRPALAAGQVVIGARYADSTLAYQGYGAGVPLEHLRALESIATGGLVPDLTILLDLPSDTGLERKTPGEVTRFEAEYDGAFHRRVRDGFLTLAAASPQRFVVIDATRPPGDVAEAVNAAADRLVGVNEPKLSAARTRR